MLLLFVLWAALGQLVALVVRPARVWPADFAAPRWLWLLAGGAFVGLFGGWLGSLVFGRFFGAPTALWFSAVIIAVGPWLVLRLRAQLLRAGDQG